MRYKYKETIILLLNDMENNIIYAFNNLKLSQTNDEMRELLIRNRLSLKVINLIREYKIVLSRLKIFKIKVKEDKIEVSKLSEDFKDLQKNYNFISTQWQELNKLVKEI